MGTPATEPATHAQGSLRRRLGEAASRARAYLALLGWLIGVAVRTCHRTMLASATASVVSIVLHGAALSILVRSVSAIQAAGHLEHFPLLDLVGIELPAPAPGALLALFVALFALGSLLGYVGRSIAIHLESVLYRHFTDHIVERLTVRDDDAQKLFKVMRRPALGERHQLLRILMSDSRFPGVAVRLVLYNITHLGNIAVGLAVLVFHAPLLLPLIAAFALLAAAAMYPLTLRAARTTRRLEEYGAQRASYLKARLGSALDTTQSDPLVQVEMGGDGLEDDFNDVTALGDAPAADAPDGLRDYLALLEERLRVTELSRVIMSSMVAAGIGLLVWLLFTYQELHIASASSLLVLLFGLRFVLMGIEGSMITLTTINRFLPHLVRLHALVEDLEREHRREAPDLSAEFGFLSGTWRDGAIEPGPANVAPGPLPGWRLTTPGLQQVAGLLEPGAVHCLAGARLDAASGLAQFEALVAAVDGGEDNAVTRLRAAQAGCPDLRKVNVLDADDAAWIAAMVSAGRLAIDADTVQLIAGLASPLRKADADAVRFLIPAAYLARQALPLMVLEARALASLNETGQALVLARFADRALLIVDHDSRRALARAGGGLLFLSARGAVVGAVPMGERAPVTDLLLEAILSGEWLPGGTTDA